MKSSLPQGHTYTNLATVQARRHFEWPPPPTHLHHLLSSHRGLDARLLANKAGIKTMSLTAVMVLDPPGFRCQTPPPRLDVCKYCTLVCESQTIAWRGWSGEQEQSTSLKKSMGDGPSSSPLNFVFCKSAGLSLSFSTWDNISCQFFCLGLMFSFQPDQTQNYVNLACRLWHETM